MVETIIVGAGMAGLAAGFELKKKKGGVNNNNEKNFLILEAQERAGGKIYSKTDLIDGTGKKKVQCYMDVGASWVGAQ